jgi:hypothetical protein
LLSSSEAARPATAGLAARFVGVGALPIPAVAVLGLLGAVLTGCGSAKSVRTRALHAPGYAQLTRQIGSLVPIVQHHGRLSRSDYRLLRETIPRELPFLPAATARLRTRGTRGRYWLAPGVVGEGRHPGACLYWQMPDATSVGASCFNLETLRRGRAVALFRRPGASATDIVGIVPPRVTTVVVESGRTRTERLHPQLGFYALRVRAPRELSVFFGDGRSEGLGLALGP